MLTIVLLTETDVSEYQFLLRIRFDGRARAKGRLSPETGSSNKGRVWIVSQKIRGLEDNRHLSTCAAGYTGLLSTRGSDFNGGGVEIYEADF